MTAPDAPPTGGGKTMKLPVLGRVRTQWVWVAGALVVGIVGYAWWSRGQGGTTEGELVVDPSAGSLDGSGGRPLTTAPGGTVDETGGQITTNEQWSAAVVTKLSEVGYEPGFVASALGKYLSKQPLSTDEADVVRTAWALLGRPPQGNYPIEATPEPPSAPKPPATPSNFRATKVTRTSVTLQWNAVAGATRYHVTRVGSTRGGARKQGTTHVSDGLKPNTTYTYKVQAQGAAGNSGWATTTARTAK